MTNTFKNYEFLPLDESDTVEKVIDVSELEFDEWGYVDNETFDADSFSIGCDWQFTQFNIGYWECQALIIE